MELKDFYNRRQGENCLIIGNGKGLNDIPNWFLQSYPSFGSNCIFWREGFKPTYYAAVDRKVQRLYAHLIEEFYPDTPKFIPSDLYDWQGQNFYRFHHAAHDLWPEGWQWDENTLTKPGIAWITVTHVLIQLAYFMGFERMLCVGLDNTEGGEHFYGTRLDTVGAPVDLWDKGYGELLKGMEGRVIINLSTHTAVTTLPRADWKKYVTQ